MTTTKQSPFSSFGFNSAFRYRHQWPLLALFRCLGVNFRCLGEIDVRSQVLAFYKNLFRDVNFVGTRPFDAHLNVIFPIVKKFGWSEAIQYWERLWNGLWIQNVLRYSYLWTTLNLYAIDERCQGQGIFRVAKKKQLYYQDRRKTIIRMWKPTDIAVRDYLRIIFQSSNCCCLSMIEEFLQPPVCITLK